MDSQEPKAIDVLPPRQSKNFTTKNKDESADYGERSVSEIIGANRSVRLWNHTSVIDLFLQFIGSFAAIAAGAARPLMTLVFAKLLNAFNTSSETSSAELKSLVNKNVLWFVYLFIAKFALSYVYGVAFASSANRITRSLRLAYVRAIISQGVVSIEYSTPGSVVTDLSSNIDVIRNGLSERIGLVLQSTSTVVTGLIIAFFQSWSLTLVTSTAIVLLFFCSGIAVRFETALERKISAVYAQAAGLVEEALASIQILMAFGACDKIAGKHEDYLNTAKEYNLRKSSIVSVKYATSYFILLSAYAISFWYGIRILLRGKIENGGKVVIVILCVNLATNAISQLLISWAIVSKGFDASKALLETITRKVELDPFTSDGMIPRECNGKFELSNVSFIYPSRPTFKVLADLNLVFEAGKTTAIVGPSGSGKSTIVAILERWYSPSQGEILLDGVPVDTLNLRWMRSQIGLVQQEPFLFNDSVYANVANGLHGTRMANLQQHEKRSLVENACVEANIHDFICQLPHGYDTIVGERGSRFSGGQKQRISIARAIVSNPKILLLDEATSALDPNSEQIVQNALEKVSRSRTTIVIAHKLSTVQNADKIVVLQRGQVIEEGTHQALFASKGAYFRLVSAQNLDGEIDDVTSEAVASNSLLQNPVPGTQPSHQSAHDLSEIETTPEGSVFERDTISRKLPLITCLQTIFGEQKQLQFLFLIGSATCVAAGAVYPCQSVLFGKVMSIFEFTGATLDRKSKFWALMFFVLAIGIFFAFAALGVIFTIMASIVMRHYRGEYFIAMLRQDNSFFDQKRNSSGALTARLASHSQQLQDLISTTLGFLIVIIVNLLSSCTLALVVSWRLGLVAIFGSLPPIVLAGYLRVRLESKKHDQDTDLFDESARFAGEAVAAIKTVSSLAMELEVCNRYRSRLQIPMERSYRNVVLTMALFAFSESAAFLGMGFTFWYGGRLLAQRELNSYEYFVIFIAIVSGGEGAGQFFANTNSIVKAQSAANHILHLRSSTPVISGSTGRTLPRDFSGDTIQFRDVSFHYPTRMQVSVLKNFNLRVKHGQNIAIVGPSGSGKSTIIALLERFYDATSGDIYISGQPLPELDINAYRAVVSLVSQETCLYQGTIRENILLGIKGDVLVSEHDLIKACRDANIYDFIVSLPQGFETECGNKGLAISGGQRQRIAIARALIRDPAILLLDEATSALDTESEKTVQEALENATKGRTTITVAHRLSTVKSAHCIFVLVEGVVKESGTHDQLLSQKGLYWKMCKMQSLDQNVI